MHRKQKIGVVVVMKLDKLVLVLLQQLDNVMQQLDFLLMNPHLVFYWEKIFLAELYVKNSAEKLSPLKLLSFP